MKKPILVATDFESVLVPEVWVAIAEKLGVDELLLTTRDVPDFDELMRGRIAVLKDKNISLRDIEKIIETLEPISGAKEFLDWARETYQVVILSDSFYEFTKSFVKKLGMPSIFCNWLDTDSNGFISGYHRLPSRTKEKSVKAFGALDFKTIAIGDSYNDIGMLSSADHGILIHAPDEISAKFPVFTSVDGYSELKDRIEDFAQAE